MFFRSLKYCAATFALIFAANSKAEVVTESWMRQAGISCGGGLSLSVQGELDAAVMRRLKIASIEGDGKYQKSDAVNLLNQFKQEEKNQTYTNYINCLISLMNMASQNSGLPPKEIVLNSPVAVASLEIVRRGQRFVMAPGDTVAIKNHALLFTVNRVDSGNVSYVWSNSEKGESIRHIVQQADLVKMGEGCSIVPYKIDSKLKQVSFLSNC